MKKIIKFFKNNLCLIFLIILINFFIICTQINHGFDAIDLYYLVPQGKYILGHGVYHIDPFSMHAGLNVIVQNYLSSVIFYLIYKLFSWIGFTYLTIFCNSIIIILIYKICKLISNNKNISFIVTLINSILLFFLFIRPRPQLFSYINLLLVIYLLELHIHKNNKKYLYFIPIISLIQINMHASLFLMILLFILPYIIDGFKIKRFNFSGYNNKPIIITFIISFITGFINPYGIKNIAFIFGSFNNSYMKKIIPELYPTWFNTSNGTISVIVMVICILLYLFVIKKKYNIRYLCLFLGTMILGINSLKGFSNFLLVGIFPFAYYFKNAKIDLNLNKLMNIIITIFCLILVAFSINNLIRKRNIDNIYVATSTYDFLLKHYDKNSIKAYTGLEDGGYGMFRGVKTYIDCRAEYFLKYNNKKYDYLKEFYLLQQDNLDINSFLDKYKFTHLIINEYDILYNLIEINNYTLIYISFKDNYKLYVRNDLIKDDTPKVNNILIKINN